MAYVGYGLAAKWFSLAAFCTHFPGRGAHSCNIGVMMHGSYRLGSQIG